ncbi:hypothetical protein SUGI_1519480 [Cryptomeria japonica]|uniref:Uncharacterized protein n=1 Tax=Cryptomeria japonica TaxID=3369 RepID=A0AAD3NVB4_CRYJA|nr:hypothetical protein SUGI_1519480 [Cryptomeria japonica]
MWSSVWGTSLDALSLLGSLCPLFSVGPMVGSDVPLALMTGAGIPFGGSLFISRVPNHVGVYVLDVVLGSTSPVFSSMVVAGGLDCVGCGGLDSVVFVGVLMLGFEGSVVDGLSQFCPSLQHPVFFLVDLYLHRGLSSFLGGFVHSLAWPLFRLFDLVGHSYFVLDWPLLC